MIFSRRFFFQIYISQSVRFAMCVGLSTGSVKCGLTGISSRWSVRQGQTVFFARGGFLVLLCGRQKNEEKITYLILI
jgi:hypothetical protein